MLNVQMEQWVNLWFLVKLGKTFTETYAMLKEVYWNEFLSRTQVFEWFKRFKDGCETTEDDPRPGGPSRQKRTKTLKILVGLEFSVEKYMGLLSDELSSVVCWMNNDILELMGCESHSTYAPLDTLYIVTCGIQGNAESPVIPRFLCYFPDPEGLEYVPL
ncbi:hypothetical protein NQ318_001323 [Aromia moschata]|uniref:Mos1 transposase HTH domain-containing protein n=1 Tax=Aromia moschata TaxID=1265417 RepID=A0AAV8ZHG9_9CUCU|nr:hypothetical protein NQ318_001323 [Aromia moschata]